MPRERISRARPPIEPKKSVNFEEVLGRLEDHGRPYDPDFLRGVYRFSEKMHAGQARRSGEPYLTHPIYVAYLLADLKFDQTCVAVGLLHDVLEDTLTTRKALAERFGDEIAEIVDGVTKIGAQAYVRRDQAQAETFRKMILASARDLRVILVKLADRLHNMMTLAPLAAEKRRRIARETLEIYAPIANRLGMSKLQGDLEDLAFYHLYPLQYAQLERELRGKLKGARKAIHRIRQRLKETLSEAGIEADISYRVKRYYSIYRKLIRQGIDISRLYDYLAFRIVTEDLRQTYLAFGVVHQTWQPIPGRFKDYIAMPKPNLYQSLHTTVLDEGGRPFEVQIRTREMDLVAEEGIAAHWHYKENGQQQAPNDPNIRWLRQLLDWQQEVQDPRTFLATLKIDLYPDEVYVFTPKGDAHAFPRGATPLDFAYRIHTDLGHHCSGARVNGKLVPLKTPLQNGDRVEILTHPNRRPSRDWLKYVTTSRAKSKIRHWLNTEQKREAQALGKRLFEREVKRAKVSLRRLVDSPKMTEYLKGEGLQRLEELYEKIGFGKSQARRVVERLTEPQDDKPGMSPLRRAVDRVDQLLRRDTGPVQVRGEGDFLTYLAKCCNPVPGDPLAGYVTRGRGIAVHSAECKNVRNLLYDDARAIEVEWARNIGGTYPAYLAIQTEDQQGMLARLTEVIAKGAGNIRQCEAETLETGLGLIRMVVEVRSRKHLDRLCQAIGGLRGVLDVSRNVHPKTFH